MKKTIFLLVALLVTVSATAAPRLIAVNGKGSFEQEADMIRVSFAVVSQDESDLEEARAQVESSAKRIVKALVGLDVSEDDIRSVDFTVNMRENFGRGDCPAPAPVVSRTVEVLIREIKNYQKVLDALVQNGANRISRVTAELSDEKALERKALLAAMQDAKEQAKFLVEGLGAKLGRVHSIGERQAHRRPFLEQVAMRASASESDAEPYEFKPQPVEVNATIYVEFEME